MISTVVQLLTANRSVFYSHNILDTFQYIFFKQRKHVRRYIQTGREDYNHQQTNIFFSSAICRTECHNNIYHTSTDFSFWLYISNVDTYIL